MSTKGLIALGVTAFMSLLFYTATRLSSDALGLALGVVVGVIATLPITLIAVIREREARKELERVRGEAKTGFTSHGQVIPPIIVVPQQMVDKQVNIYRERKKQSLPEQRERQLPGRRETNTFPVRQERQIEDHLAGTTEEEKEYPRVYR